MTREDLTILLVPAEEKSVAKNFSQLRPFQTRCETFDAILENVQDTKVVSSGKLGQLNFSLSLSSAP